MSCERRAAQQALSSMTFIVSWLAFKSFIHFEFTLVYVVSWWSTFIFLHVPVQFSQHHLLKRLSLLHCMLMPPLSNINLPRYLGLFLGSLLCSFPMCLFVMLVPDCFYYIGLVVWFDIRYWDPSYFVILSQDC